MSFVLGAVVGVFIGGFVASVKYAADIQELIQLAKTHSEKHHNGERLKL